MLGRSRVLQRVLSRACHHQGRRRTQPCPEQSSPHFVVIVIDPAALTASRAATTIVVPCLHFLLYCLLYASPSAARISFLQLEDPPSLAYLLSDPHATKATLRFLANWSHFDLLHCPPPT